MYQQCLLFSCFKIFAPNYLNDQIFAKKLHMLNYLVNAYCLKLRFCINFNKVFEAIHVKL